VFTLKTSDTSPWPALPFAEWSATRATLHLWTQIVGKIRLARTPWVNHSWHVPLYVTARGLSTSLIPYGPTSFEICFDFIEHALRIDVSDGQSYRVNLKSQAVADFYDAVMTALECLGIPVSIDQNPCEIQGAIPFGRDRDHDVYDPHYARRFWQVLVQADRVLKRFRTGFIGKSSPVHFFWGSFDLAVTRFSGRRAPPYPGQAPGVSRQIMLEAYSHEVSSAGFWPGGNGTDFAAFYSYAYPQAAQFRACAVRPTQAKYNEELDEFLLPYEAVRQSRDPDGDLLEFLQSTYEAAADCAHWSRSELECAQGNPGVPRPV
jgi:hypothetical protein